ncbi:MAG: hypothetical protein QGH15_06560 [Kiritimatiellia bacterium]|nr:hypothetical protein [Kiritimatiellia bacterium]
MISKAGQEIRVGSGSAPAWLAVHDGHLYFSANDGVHGNEIWRFDGTNSSLVADVNPDGQYGSFNPAWMTSYDGALYLSANDGGGDGNELWRYDGTNVEMIANINTNPPGSGGDDFLADSNPFYLTVHDGKLFFTADDGVHGRELWAYDGISCYMVTDIRSSDQYGSNPSGLAIVEGDLYLAADSGEGFGLELYRVVPAPRVLNGGFEAGSLAPWVLTGAGAAVYDTVFDPPIVPAAGEYMGYITTLNNEGAEDFGYFDDSPDIDLDGEREREYSSLSITFTASAPCTVSFDLNFLTDELLPGETPDAEADLFGLTTGDIRSGPYLLLFAVAPSDGSYTGRASQLTPGAFSDQYIEENNYGVFPTIPDASRFQGQTGFSNYWFLADPGIHTWTFFVADSHTDGVSSAMLIDNMRMTSRRAPTGGVTNFGSVTVAAAFELNGAGNNIDSIAFWEAPDPTNTLMFVTAKGNDRLEIWEFPFVGNELPFKPFSNNVNGVAVDQETDLLYVSDRRVSVFSLPGLQPQGEFGEGTLGAGENNLDILKETGGRTLIYVSDDHNVHDFDAANSNYLGSFAPPVSSIETVLADDFYQLIMVPEEQGPVGNPGVYVYRPDGTPFEMNGTNRFGNNGEFDSDEEGIVLYTFPASGLGDDGTGFIVVSDQRSSQTDFEFFDRWTWSHLGRLRIDGVSNTDGIASTQRPLPGYPLGLFAAVDNDSTVACVGWDVIFEAIGYTAYQVWALASGLDLSVNAGALDDADGDGVSNIREFALNGDPLSAAGNNKERVLTNAVTGTNHFLYTFPVRNGAVFTGEGELSGAVDGIVYSLSGSITLGESNEDVEELVPALQVGLPQLDTGWSYRTFRLSRPLSELQTGFIRLATDPE